MYEFEVKIRSGKKTHEAVIDPNGKIVTSEMKAKKEKEEHEEQENDCPSVMRESTDSQLPASFVSLDFR